MEIASLLAFFVAIIAGIKLLDWGIQFLSNYISGIDQVLPIMAFAMIFIGTIILVNFIGKTLKQFLDMTLLGNLDDVAGAITGVAKWVLFISIFIWIYESFAGNHIAEMAKTSILYEPISTIAPGVFRIFSALYPTFMEMFDTGHEMINNNPINV